MMESSTRRLHTLAALLHSAPTAGSDSDSSSSAAALAAIKDAAAKRKAERVAAEAAQEGSDGPEVGTRQKMRDARAGGQALYASSGTQMADVMNETVPAAVEVKRRAAALSTDEQGKLTTNTPTLFNAYENASDVMNMPAAGAAEATRPVARLENGIAALEVDLAGGSLSSFTLLQQEGGTNPLSWRAQVTADGSPAPLGHFLCCDRWGGPSEAEIANGMPFHGEASSSQWSRRRTQGGSSDLRLGMGCDLPMAGMSVERQLSMVEGATAVHIVETVTNTNPLGRMYNVVQHPSIAPPFLDVETLVDTNATQGFPQSAFPELEAQSTTWPLAALTADGSSSSSATTTTDVRTLAEGENDVCSYVIDDEYGWVTAVSPTTNLLIGYFWRSKDYPWFSAWRNSDEEDGSPSARGLEFGTTGVHQPFPELAAMPTVLGRPTFSFLDAGASHSRAYCMFLCESAGLEEGVQSATYSASSGELTLQGAGGGGAEVVLSVGELP